jgi:hypothetical protein
MAFTMNVGLTDMPTIYNVSYGVGYERSNTRDDVYLVQKLLQFADVPVFSGGLPIGGTGMITVDGYFGSETNRMIGFFQRELEKQRKLFQKGNNIDAAKGDGFTNKGVLYLIVHLNRLAKDKRPNEYMWMPYEGDTPPLLQRALAKGAIRPTPVYY